MVIFTMFVDMTALSNNITNRDGLWRVDSDSVTITTSYSEKQPEKLNVCIYNHSNSTIYRANLWIVDASRWGMEIHCQR